MGRRGRGTGVKGAGLHARPEAGLPLATHGGSAPRGLRRDCHLQCIAEHGCMGWRKRTGYNRRSKAETAVARWKRVIGDGLRSRTDERRVNEVEVAAHALNRVLELGRPSYIRIA